MTATRNDLSRWFDRGAALGATHMIVALDPFDYTNWPIYVMPGEDVREVKDKHLATGNRVDEVYNYSLEKAPQFAVRRAWNY